MNNHKLANLILEKYGHRDVSIVVQKSGLNSKCEMTETGGKLYLGPVNVTPNALMVASHESSHYLNYSEGKSNYRLLKKLDNWFKLSFLLIPIAFALTFTNYEYLKWVVTLVFFLIFFVKEKFYVSDEVRTQKRALQEIYNLQSSKDISFEMNSIKKMHNRMLYYHIYFNTILILIMLPIFYYSFVFCLPEFILENVGLLNQVNG